MFEIDATNLPRLMACNGSRLMGGALPPITTDNQTRDEGNAAHYMALAVYNNEFTIEELIDRKAPNGIYMSVEMAEHVKSYLDAIYLRTTGTEIETSFGGDTWRVNARADHIGYDQTNNILYIDDLKYGFSWIEPEKNWTLIAHAIGYSIRNQIQPNGIMFIIHQPRGFHPDGPVREWSCTYAELLAYYAEIVQTMTSPNDELHTSDHCKRCPALSVCPAAAKAGMNAIDASDMAFDAEIDNNMLSYELDTLNLALTRLNYRLEALQELAKHRIKSGEVVQNYQLERELTNRKFKQYITPDIFQALTGVDIRKEKMGTPADASRAGLRKEIVDLFTERVETGVKLKRVNVHKKASRHFG